MLEGGTCRGGIFNIQGLMFNYPDTATWMETEKLHWLVLTETWLARTGPFTVYPVNSDEKLVSLVEEKRSPTDRSHGRGGLALLVEPNYFTNVEVIANDKTKGRWGVWRLDNLIIIGVYLAPSLTLTDVRNCRKQIDDVLDNYLDKQMDKGEDVNQLKIIYCGDFNARLPHHQFVSNDRGSLIEDWIEDRQLSLVYPDETDFSQWLTTAGSDIETRYAWYDLFFTNGSACDVSVFTDRKETGLSDHYPVILSYPKCWNGATHQSSPREPVLRFKVNRLKDLNIRNKYVEEVRKRVFPYLEWLNSRVLVDIDRQRLVDVAFSKVVDIFQKSASKILGVVNKNSNTRCRRTVPQTEALSRASIKYRRLLRDGDTNRTRFRRKLREVQRERIAALVEARRLGFESYVSRLNELSPASTMQILSRIRRGKVKGLQPAITQEKLDGIAEHYFSQFTPCETVNGIDMPQKVDVEMYQEVNQGDAFDTPLTYLPFCPKRVASLISRSGSSKASGLDGLTKELMNFELSSEEENPFCLVVSELFNFFWRLGTLPSEWSKSLVVPIYKNKGDRTDYANWRPISLLIYLRKLFESRFQNDIIGNGFHYFQGGFVKKRSTLDQVLALQTAIESASKNGKKVYMAFLDIWAAYDTVDRNLLWDRLRERGVNERIIRLLAKLSSNNKFQVVGDSKRSKEIKALAGVQQGGTLSPHLYNVMMDTLCTDLEQSCGNDIVRIDGTPMPAFMFADDVCLLATSEAELHSLLKTCETHSRTWKYRWKPSKSAIVSNVNRTSRFFIYNEQIKVSEMFVYLGIPFRADGIDMKELAEKNIRKTMAATIGMGAIGAFSNRFSLHRRSILWKSFVRSCLEYGLVLGKFNKTLMNRLTKTHTSGLRSALNGKSKSCISSMTKLANCRDVQERIWLLQAKFFLRIRDSPESALIGKLKNYLFEAEDTFFSDLIRKNKLWNFFINGNYNNVDSALVAFTCERERSKITKLQSTGKGILISDIPPAKKLFKGIDPEIWNFADSARLFHWLTGAFPGHQGTQCLVCEEPLFSQVRDHVASCIKYIFEEELVVKNLFLTEDMKRRYSVALSQRSTINNWIIDTLWLAGLSRDGLNSSAGVVVRNALRSVNTICLGRN